MSHIETGTDVATRHATAEAAGVIGYGQTPDMAMADLAGKLAERVDGDLAPIAHRAEMQADIDALKAWNGRAVEALVAIVAACRKALPECVAEEPLDAVTAVVEELAAVRAMLEAALAEVPAVEVPAAQSETQVINADDVGDLAAVLDAKP